MSVTKVAPVSTVNYPHTLESLEDRVRVSYLPFHLYHPSRSSFTTTSPPRNLRPRPPDTKWEFHLLGTPRKAHPVPSLWRTNSTRRPSLTLFAPVPLLSRLQDLCLPLPLGIEEDCVVGPKGDPG